MSWLDSVRQAFGGAPRFAVAAETPEQLTVELTTSSLSRVRDFLDGATTSVDGELFRLQHERISGGIRSAAERGVAQRYLVDPEGFDAVRSALPDAVEASAYAQMPFKNHSKGLVVDGTRALMTTGAYVPKTDSRVEMVARFEGEAAKALRELVDAGRSAQPERLRAAADTAARYGIVVNEPVAGVQHLTGAVHDLIRSARRDITISTKIFTDPTVRAAVADAERRGVRVRFTDIRAQHMHANLVVADDSLYVGTAHFSPRGMGDMRLAYRRSRESGLVVHDAGRAQAMRQDLDDLGMVAYKPEEFEQSRKLFTKIDAFGKAQEDGVTGERMAQISRERDEATTQWRALSQEVRSRRSDDGITFTNPSGNAAR